MLRKNKKGFTLIELIIALSIAAVVITMVVYMIMSSLEMRKKAARLNTAIFLAENLMNQIQNQRDLVDDQGDFQENPGFSFSYSMKENEFDPFSGTMEPSGTGDKKQAPKTPSPEAQYREGQTTEFSAGVIIFTLKKYTVIIYYKGQEIYHLESLRDFNHKPFNSPTATYR